MKLIAVISSTILFVVHVGWASASDMTRVADQFCIDRFEASLGISPIDGLPVAESRAGVLPAVNITQVQAAEACARAGKRLCTDSEWLRACQGPDSLTYPYGNDLQVGACNDGGQLAVTGSYTQCESVDGALDLVGNVNEWTADPSGTFRGGSYVDISINGPGCFYRTTAHSTGHSDQFTGFRCCAEECDSATISVEIDIKPGSEPNCFNINGHGVVPVAVLGSAAVDVTSIDTSSLLFDGLQVRVRGKKGPNCSIQNVNPDTYPDLVCQFEDDSENWVGGNETASLSGSLLNGDLFEGTDSVCIVP